MSALTYRQLLDQLASLPLEDDEPVLLEVDLGPAQRFAIGAVVYEEPLFDDADGFGAVLVAGELVDVGGVVVATGDDREREKVEQLEAEVERLRVCILSIGALVDLGKGAAA